MEALLLCALAFGPLAFGAVEAWSLAVLQALVFAALALAILRGAKREGRSQLAPFFVSVVGIAVLGFLQFLHPRPLTQPSAILPFTVAVHRTGPAALLWAAYAALLWCASRALDGRPALRRLAWTVFLVGTAVAVIGLMQGGQGNNAYIFPGLGMGVISSGSRLIPDEMFLTAARTLAETVSQEDLALGRIYPSLTRIREVSLKIALAVAHVARKRGLATKEMGEDLEDVIAASMYQPEYISLV